MADFTEEERTKFAERAEALNALINSEGWKLFADMVTSSMALEMQRLMAASDGHQMAIHKGAFKALEGLRTWPHREAEALIASLVAQPE
jgi:hypothetical protein